MSDNISSTGKIMTQVVLNGFAGERFPLSSVNRVLNAIDNIEDRCMKQESKGDMMKSIAKLVANELKGEGEPKEDKADPLDTFLKEQAKVNKAILAKLG